MPEVRTGPVRVSGYAIKLRRALNAAVKEQYKKSQIDTQKLNEQISEFNKKLYSVIVEKFKIPKEAIVNITVKYEYSDGNLKIDDVNVEVYNKDDALSKDVTEEVKKLFK